MIIKKGGILMWLYGNGLNGFDLIKAGMWVILIILAIYLIRRLRPNISTASTHSTALKKAHREIEPEEFQQHKEEKSE
jgi:uncharacterized membrane protein